MPPGIYIAAFFTTLCALMIIGGILWRLFSKEERTLGLIALVCTLPLCAFVLHNSRTVLKPTLDQACSSCPS